LSGHGNVLKRAGSTYAQAAAIRQVEPA